jgi:hypothetical protein
MQIGLTTVPIAEPPGSAGVDSSSEGEMPVWKSGLCREPGQVDFPPGRLKADFSGFSPGIVVASAVAALGESTAGTNELPRF